MLRSLRTPKVQMLIAFVLLLGIAVPASGGLALWPKLVAAVVPACLIDGLWMSLPARKPRFPMSALLTGLFVFSILSVEESWLVVAWTSTFAVLSKRILSTGREHIFNPAALALVWAPIAFGSGESWWGAFGDMPWVWMIVLAAAGLFITDRLNKFPLVLSFLAIYFGFFTIGSVYNPHAVTEMFREPFLQAALFLAFFMLTDPPTSPNRYLDQVWFGVLAGLTAGAAQLLGAGQVYLLIGILVPNAVLALVRWARRQGAENVARPQREIGPAHPPLA
ncbi:MAG: RnfABCDGE type electron transport complex subunit D [Chloroflexi bacterium]|nr:RnfABCDGE type electron transport complex subunit D [Chloroflexota bacterium]MBV9896072.1 RnfABCDGE type electron transport complex subunit D [Chloroflexota bacterium]